MKEINKFVKKSVSKLDLSVRERKELEAEYIDHITEIYKEHLEDGFSEKESLDYAISIFKSDNWLGDSSINQKKNYIQFGLLSIFFIYLIVLVPIYFYISRMEVFKSGISINSFIPFRTIYAIITSSMDGDFGNIMRLQRRIVLFLSLIPMGIFIPIITSKYKSFLSNLKIYLFIALFLELCKILFPWWISIDYILLNLISCIIGYGLFTIIRKYVVQKRAINI